MLICKNLQTENEKEHLANFTSHPTKKRPSNAIPRHSEFVFISAGVENNHNKTAFSIPVFVVVKKNSFSQCLSTFCVIGHCKTALHIKITLNFLPERHKYGTIAITNKPNYCDVWQPMKFDRGEPMQPAQGPTDEHRGQLDRLASMRCPDGRDAQS
jgi:hypothetical protein